MNILDLIEQTLSTVAPVAQKSSGLTNINYLPSLTNLVTELVDRFEQMRGSLQLLTEIYRVEAPLQVELARFAVYEAVALLTDVEAFLAYGSAYNVSNALRESLGALDTAVRAVNAAIGAHRKQVSEQVTAAQVLLKMPDLLTSIEDERVLQQAIDYISRFNELDPGKFASADGELGKAFQNQYSTLTRLRAESSFERLQQRHQLSEQTVALIRNLLDGQTIPIAEISPQTLQEFMRLDHIRGQITMQLRTR